MTTYVPVHDPDTDPWVDLPDESTPLDAAGLTQIEQGIVDASVAADEAQEAAGAAATAAAEALTDANTYTDTAVGDLSDATDLALADKADLVGGVVPTSQIPAIAINDTVVVASEAAMLALTAQRGDVAVRTDLTPHRVFLLTADTPATLAAWVEITAAGSVITVNGQSGAVTLGFADVGAASTTDPRLSDARTPSANSVTDASVADEALAQGKIAGLVSALAAKLGLSLFTAKGALVAGTAASTAGTLAVGTNGQVLTADSAEATGMKWAAASAAGVTLSGSAAPTTEGGNGDWYRRSDVLGTLYRKISGAWVKIGAAANWLDYKGGTMPAGWQWAGSRTIEPASAATRAQVFNISDSGGSGFSMSGNSPTITVTGGDMRGGFDGMLGGGGVVKILTMPGSGQTLRLTVGLDIAGLSAAVPSVVVNNAGTAQVDSFFTTGVFTFPTTVAVNHTFAFVVMAGGIFIVHANSSGVILASTFVTSQYATPEIMPTYPLMFGVGGHGQVQIINGFLATEAL